ncbi:MAG: tetraacyldisaccharide 4'-kinase [Vicinamibacterales bacterium]
MSLLSGLYGHATQIRRSYYRRAPARRRRLARPVISVGNLTVGGSGKTPAVAALARLLLARGERPAILSRGYGRRQQTGGVVVVSDGTGALVPVEASGDEPQLLARTLPGVPVLVAASRYAAGRLAETRFDCTVSLLDDGFQHVQLERDVDLLLVSAADLDDRVLPAGRLREPLSAAHAAHALVVPADEEIARFAGLGVGAVFQARVRALPARLLQPAWTPAPDGGSLPVPGAAPAPMPSPGAAVSPASVPASLRVPEGTSRRVVVLSAIARPERFVRTLRGEGWEVAAEIACRDHHWFTADDVRRVAQAVYDSGASLVMTTEKDAMRLGDAPLDLPCPCAYLPIETMLEPEAAFADWLATELTRARARKRSDAA